MGDRKDVRPGVGAPAAEPGRVAYDHHWARDLHSSIRCSAAFLALLFAIDWGTGDLTWWRSALWLTLALLLFLVLCPPRVCAGEGWMASRALLRSRRVRTDLLVSVRTLDGVAQLLVLRDAVGGRVEIDPRVLVNNPDLWYRLDEDARKSAASGCLRSGTDTLRHFSERLERETALTVFRISGLDS
ncbi:hypothetical protein RKE30_27535 [Streptomyces sp. Li-HN-5-11]|uniref:hypothetical protein n=1 Tax=Streptomyces sp. Li-HN-5-11 TaxID=3075432 RepID=UPI0028AA4A37|nr:hypothetical protein [Streptomyces sp. Li-HN-5-11]WNM33857.1 hypothetical protein RKE30_27535 [Streptomyces sp. Li-HN-5-11]